MYYTIRMQVDIKKKYIQPIVMPDVLLVPGEDKAHRWEVEVLENGEPFLLTGHSVYGRFERADGYSHRVTGSHYQNVAYLDFDSALYKIPGALKGQFFVSANDSTTALVEAYFNVRMDVSGNVVLSVDEITYTEELGRIIYDSQKFYDVSGTTATQGDVRAGKTFFLSNGQFVEGDTNFDVTFSGTMTAELIDGEDYKLIFAGGEA